MADGRLRRSDWEVRDVTQPECLAAVAAWHYAKGAPNTSVHRHGLFRSGCDELMGVAMWLPPTKNAAASVAVDWRGVLSLTRLVCSPEAPKNAASFLLGTSMRLVDRDRWPVLLTYADTSEGHTGAIYKATNWTCLGYTPAGDTWIAPDGTQRGRKRGARNLSVVEMRALGLTRKPAAPKIKFVHRAKEPHG